MTNKVHDIAQLGTILGVWAHPDDETWSMGGLLAQASKNGQRTACITASRGEAGLTSDEFKWPQAELANIRKKELEESLKILGVVDHRWLDCHDGKMMNMESEECITRITQIIEEIQPDSIFTFGADGLTGHTDHIAIHNWTVHAIKQSRSTAKLYTVAEYAEHFSSAEFERANKKFNMFTENNTPNLIKKSEATIFFALNDDIKDKKLRALKAHASQVDRLIKDVDGYDFVLSLCNSEAFIRENL